MARTSFPITPYLLSAAPQNHPSWDTINFPSAKQLKSPKRQKLSSFSDNHCPIPRVLDTMTGKMIYRNIEV